MERYCFTKIGLFSSRSFHSTTTAQKIREIKVEIAAPSTPIWKPKIRMAFPPMFIKLEITEITIGLRLLFCARRMDAPAS